MAQSLITPERVIYYKRTRFNPLRNLTPESLSRQLDEFNIGGLRNPAQTFEAIANRDDILKSVIPKRKSISARNWQIIIPSYVPKELKPAAERHKTYLEYFYNNVKTTDALDRDKLRGFSLLIEQMMDAVSKKWAAHEVLWEPGMDGLTATFNFVPLWFFENRFGELRFLLNDLDFYGVPLDKSHWMITAGEGLMEASSVAFMYKNLSLKDWMLYSEKLGMPGVQGKTKAAKDSPEWDNMVEAVAAIAKDFSCVTGMDDVIEKLDFSAQGELPFPKLVEAMNRALATMWRGADLSTISRNQQAVGSNPQHQEKDKLEQGDALNLSETLNLQIDPKVIEFHEGPVKPLAYIKILVPEQKDASIELSIDQGLTDLGVEIGVEDVRERYGRRKPEPGEDVLEKVTPVNPLGGFGGPDLVSKNGKPSSNGRNGIPSDGAVMDEFSNEALEDRLLLKRARENLAKTSAEVFQPVLERFQGVLSQTNEFAFWAALEKVRQDFPDLLTQINSDPKSAKVLEGMQISALFNGLAQGLVGKRR